MPYFKIFRQSVDPGKEPQFIRYTAADEENAPSALRKYFRSSGQREKRLGELEATEYRVTGESQYRATAVTPQYTYTAELR